MNTGVNMISHRRLREASSECTKDDQLVRMNEILERINRLIELQTGMPSSAPSESAGDEISRIGQALDRLDAAISEQVSQEKTLSDMERFSTSILACTPQAIIAAGIDGLITVFSPGAEHMLGYSADEIVGKQTPLLFLDQEEVRVRAEELSNEFGFTFEPDFDVLVAKTKNSTKPDAREWTYIGKDGVRVKVLLEATPLLDEHGAVNGWLGVATDITARSLAVAEIEQLAYYDHLTHLPNRRLFHDRMQVAITQARRENARLALMLVDLDKFKPVNDNLGHAVGDLLLKAVARRMLDCLRDSDTLARVGGDEFVVILPEVVSGQDALIVAEKIRLALNEPFELAGGYKVSIACSIGVAIYPDHGSDEKRLSRNVDDAMYAAKEMGRNCVQLFTAVPDRGTESRIGALDLRLVWHSAYRCGETSIDQEHQELFVRANVLIKSAMEGDGNLKQSPVLLDELISSVARHFTNEEAILGRYHYADLEDHVLKHQRLVGRALELRSMAVAGELKLGDLVTFIAQEVVAKHMLKEDTKFFPLLRGALTSQRHEPAIEPRVQ